MSLQALVFGARGQIGRGLLPRLHARGIHVHAVTRAEPPPETDNGVYWHRHDLFGDVPPELAAELVFSLGPLDGFVHWLERTPLPPARAVVFGSTSADTKHASADDAERALAERLRGLETRLATLCATRGIRWTLLRPTLVYGVGLDRNLSRIVTLARRTGVFVLPRNATGLRQPVHADDLADAAFHAAFVSTTECRRYDLPGGERLRYDEMVRRTLACLSPAPRLLRVPAFLFGGLTSVARRTGLLGGTTAGTFARLREDLVFDDTAARNDLAWTPRPFRPTEAMFRMPPR